MSLDGVYDDGNIFAKLIRGEVPSARIYEDEDTLAFMDAFPQSPGHCLIVSKTSRARNILEIEPGALAAVAETSRRVAGAVVKALSPDGVMLMQFNGAPAGQTVFHLHMHVVPRWSDQPMKGHGQAGMADPAELKATAEKIAAALG